MKEIVTSTLTIWNKMVDTMMAKINIVSLCIILVLTFGISCEGSDQSVATEEKQEVKREELNSDQVSESCDAKDAECPHVAIHKENSGEKDIKEVIKEGDIRLSNEIDEITENGNKEFINGLKENNPSNEKTEDISNELNAQSDIIEDSLQDGNSTNNDTGNNSGNSSAVYQVFKYIMEQFLEEFKDGIYSKPSEVSNVTDTNVLEPMINETIEKVEENITTQTEITPINTTEVGNTTDAKKIKFHCTGRNVTDNLNATVKLITSARLLQLLAFDKNETENMTDCLLVMFYAPWCQFCARTAPHYNAVARAFPQLDFVAVDTAQFSNLLARFGTVSVPNILVFHQSRAAAKFNQTERTFENFVSFIQNATGLEPNITVNVTEADYLGPVPSQPTDDTDYLLLISWIFVIFCSSCMFVKSHRGQQWITRVRILWQEHQHID